jgi:hypothetical protein
VPELDVHAFVDAPRSTLWARTGEEPTDGPDWDAELRRFVRDVRAAAEAF